MVFVLGETVWWKEGFEITTQFALDTWSRIYLDDTEVRWLSWHFALQALLRNVQVLTEYCKEQVRLYNDHVNKYCLKKLRDPQFRTVLSVIEEVVGEPAEWSKLLQRKNLTTIEAYQFVKGRVNNLRLQHLC